VFDVVNGFEVFLFTAIPFLVKSEIITDFVKTSNPSKSKSFHKNLTALIKDYSKTFIKIGKKSLYSLEKVPNETEMASIFATIRAVAQNDKYYEAFNKNIHLVHEMITNPKIQKDIKEQHIIDNGNAMKMNHETMQYLHTSNPMTTFVAIYSPDRTKVTFEEHQ
jgi:Zn-dependent metalloprotease